MAPVVVAEHSIAALKATPGILAICLVGSVARGDARPDSDVDLLVVASRSGAELRGFLPAPLRSPAVSLICKTPEQIHDLAATGSLFLEHVRTEGRVVHDPYSILASTLTFAASVPLDVQSEIRRRIASLRHYRRLARFGGNYLFALAHIYGVAKGLAIARCAQHGRTTFVKADALTRLAQMRPDLRADIAFIQSLRPFYDLARGHDVTSLPFDYLGATLQTERAVKAAHQLANEAG